MAATTHVSASDQFMPQTRTCMRFATRANALLDAAAHATILVLVTVAVVRAKSGIGIKAQTVNEENQGSQD
ncbi:hypothetical protein TRIUR3_18899 [Triticum urartu]|uniref:Uncharacterized protein n=1 Tax=Triticum urartu TaxID=4572 RepID=M7ZPW3_TRIUA|nr:hypothetical protein TRIUR3_18899 [Triticum urartu]